MPSFTETTDAGASTATTYTIAIGQAGQGQLSVDGDHDWYRVNLVAGQDYTFAMVGTRTSDFINTYTDVGNTYLRLLDGAGTQVAFDNDSGPGYNSTINFRATISGTYYLDAGAVTDYITGQYGISAALGNKAFYDEKMAVGALSWDNASWSPDTSTLPVSVTWGARATFDNSVNSQGAPTPFIPLSAAQTASVRANLAKYSDVANITFTQVNSGGTTDNADILVSAYSDNEDPAGAYAMYPGTFAESGDIRLNNLDVSTTSLPEGSYSAYTILHEIGHAVGLGHPGDYNANPGGVPTYDNDAAFIQDDHQYSVMSYFDESNTTSSYNSYPDTLMLYDILAVQQLYGANMSTRASNTVYGFGSNAGDTYNFAVNTTPALSIWDGGGIDTINASGFSQNQLINLNDGTFSNIGGLQGNVSIAFNAQIEIAVGGNGADSLIGNEYNNILNGRAGNDLMRGRAGNDTYLVDAAGDKVDESLAGSNGIDTIQAVVSVNLGAAAQVAGAVENVVLLGTSHINATGNALNNLLVGNSGNNILNGGAGGDEMRGGAGYDTYYVDNAADRVIEANVAGADRVHSSVIFSLAGQFIENLTLTGSANINGLGNSLNNAIAGNAGNNSLSGGTGNDVLLGGAGNDWFYFNTAPNAASNLDTILDYNVAADTISLKSAIFTALGGAGTLNADMFWASTSGVAHDASDRLVYETDTGKLFYDSNGSAAGSSTQFATLTPNLALTHADFLIT